SHNLCRPYMNAIFRNLTILLSTLLIAFGAHTFAQTAAAAKAGSLTAKGGFRNEDEIRDKFNNWRADEDAKVWLRTMSYEPSKIEVLTATKPYGEKADVEVNIRSKNGEKTEGISIKLVSSPTGFNQIDKRWLSHY